MEVCGIVRTCLSLANSVMLDIPFDGNSGMPLSAGVAAGSISLPYLRKVAMCLKMSGPLDRAEHHRPHATRRLAEHVILFSIGSKGWSVVVHEKADFSLAMADGILVTLSYVVFLPIVICEPL